MKNGDAIAQAMVAEITLAEAISVIQKNLFFTQQALPALVNLVQEIGEGAKINGRPRADGLVKGIADTLMSSSPDLAKAIIDAASQNPSRPTKKVGALITPECTPAGK